MLDETMLETYARGRYEDYKDDPDTTAGLINSLLSTLYILGFTDGYDYRKDEEQSASK